MTSNPAKRWSHTLRGCLRLLTAAADRHSKFQLAITLLLVVVVSVLSTLVPVVYKLILDSFSQPDINSTSTALVLLIGGYVGVQYVMRILGEWRTLATSQGAQRLNRRLSERLFDHIVRLPLSYHLERKTGAIGETLGQGLGGCQMVLQQLVLTVLPTIVEFAAIILVLIHFEHSAYLVILAVSAVAYLFVIHYGASRISQPARETSSAHIQAHAVLTDSLLNFETIKYFNAEIAVGNGYRRALSATENAWRRLLRFKMWNGIAVGTIFILSLGVSLVLAGQEVVRGAMTIGDFVLINTYIARMFGPLEAIGLAIRDVAQGLSFIEKMLSIYDERPEAAGSIEAAHRNALHGALEFQQVHFSYGPGRGVLSDVSFSVPAGTTTAIVGASGAGKSSLVRLLFRLYEPDQGGIMLGGIPMSSFSLRELRQAIAIVPQDTVLFNDSIGANIAFGKPNASFDEIRHAAKLARLDKLIESLPQGYATEVGERGLKLSGGEKQRVAIARAAIKRPAIFVFDEATSSLDSQTEKEILRNLFEVSRDHTTLLIAHRLSTVTHADQILVLAQGTIVERGTHAELLKRAGTYFGLWQAQHQQRSRSDDAKVISIA